MLVTIKTGDMAGGLPCAAYLRYAALPSATHFVGTRPWAQDPPDSPPLSWDAING